MTLASPEPARERIVALDVLRGVAVGGILFANVLVFFGIVFLPRDLAGALPLDRVFLLLERIFVEGKFYSIFSLLFGIGFGIQLTRGGEDAVSRFRRRTWILLAIGALHAFLLWAGDILMLYALLGFTLPWFARRGNGALLRWSVALLALPTALYAVAAVVWAFAGSGGGAASGDWSPPASILRYFQAMGEGGFRDAFVGNLVLLAGRWADLVITVRLPKVLGMFVLGLWMVRTGLALAPEGRRATLVRWAALGWGVGLPANVAAVMAIDRWPYLPPTLGGLLGTALQGVGIPMLALGYAATVALLVVNGRRILSPFAPVGRMALTNYLMQSVICVVLSYGFGFGLWWGMRPAGTMGIAAAIVSFQIAASDWWLEHFRYGPVEWVWRRLTYGRPI